MLYSPLRFVLALAIAVVTPFLASAADGGDGTLRVIRPIIRTEQDQPELCLEFDHALALQRLGKFASAIHLKAEGKNIPLSSRLLDVTGSEICVRLPDHRASYSITLSDIRGLKGEMMGNPYSLSFDVPARRANLAFVSSDSDDGVVRVPSMKPLLRAINVPEVKLELFRITDPARMAEAWLRRRQTSLAPSETTTFARTNGALVWQGQMDFDARPDVMTDHDVVLEDKIANLSDGLYLIVASAPDLRVKSTDLAPIAATWMLRSNLRIHHLSNGAGLHVFADNADEAAPRAGIHFNMLDTRQKIIASGVSDDHGIAYLESAPDKQGDAAILVASNDAGDYDFIDLVTEAAQSILLPSAEANIVLDRAAYTPDSPVIIALSAHDIHNHPKAVGESEIRILRPDRTFIASVPVASAPAGMATVTLNAPLQNGVWPIVWQQKDGRVLGETSLRVSHNLEAPIVDIAADRNAVGPDGRAILTITSHNPDGRSVPFISGRVEASWTATDHKIPGWQDYRFGSNAVVDHKPEQIASFVTGADGIVRLPITVLPPSDATGLLTISLRVVTDPVAGARGPAELNLLFKQSSRLVGVRPSVTNGHFPENSLAQFDFVALNRDGNPEATQDLSAHIYEVGRNFDWYQADGAWQYKAQQQQRLVGGDDLLFNDSGRAHLEWPIVAGTYRLDVTDADGGIVTSLDFLSGWRGGDSDRAARNDLQLFPGNSVLAVGKAETITFTLDHAAMVTAMIVDDHTRMVTHEFRPKGINRITLTATPDWGNHVLIDIVARSLSPDAHGLVSIAGGSVILPVNNPADAKQQTIAKPAAAKLLPNTNPRLPDDSNELSIIDATDELIIAPRQEKKFPAITHQKNMIASDQALALVSSVSATGVWSALNGVLHQTPYATHDITNWLSVVREWRGFILSARLMSETALRLREQELINRLLMRQKPDGSFAAYPSDDNGDLSSTAATLAELSARNLDHARPYLERAAQSLKTRLDNIWFDDRERNARPAAYMALAIAGRSDNANMHYFSDSSADKLSPLAATTLAAAFARLNDRDKAASWLGAAHIATASPDIEPALLPLLADNQFFDVGTLDAALAKQAKRNDDSIGFLIAIAHRLDRAGAWHVAVNGVDKSGKGAAAFLLPAKTDVTIRNLSDQPLYLSRAAVAQPPNNAAAALRHIFRPDGGEVVGGLAPHQTYIVVIEGDGSAKSKPPLLVRDDMRGVLRPVSCALSDAGGNLSLVWLPQLSESLNCEVADDVVQIALPALKGAQSNWRVAYIARAESQSLKGVLPPQLRPIADNMNAQSR